CPSDRRTDADHEFVRMPVSIPGLADRLCRKFWRGDDEEYVDACGLQRNHLRVDRRVGDVVGLLRDDHLCGLVTKAAFESRQIVATEIVVLPENADLRP